MAGKKVYVCNRETACTECGVDIGKGDYLFITPNSRHLCLSCADLDHLVFLPSGDVALTRRASKHSTLKAVVYKISSARKRSERLGILVQQGALEKAEQECLSDEASRQQRRFRDAQRRETWINSMCRNLPRRSVSCTHAVQKEESLKLPDMRA